MTAKKERKPKFHDYVLSNEKATHYARRGGKAKHKLDLWNVEGQLYNYTQMQDRLNIGDHALRARVRLLRSLDKPLTWAELAKDPRTIKKELRNAGQSDRSEVPDRPG